MRLLTADPNFRLWAALDHQLPGLAHRIVPSVERAVDELDAARGCVH